MSKVDKVIVAKEIANQIGNKTFYMLGAKNLVFLENSITFNIRGSKRINFIKVELTFQDLYTVTYYKARKFELEEIAKSENIYCDMLHKDLEENTGLATSL